MTNDINTPNYITLKYKISKTWRYNGENMQCIMIQTRLFQLFNFITNRLVHSFNIKVLFLMVILYRHNGLICSKCCFLMQFFAKAYAEDIGDTLSICYPYLYYFCFPIRLKTKKIIHNNPFVIPHILKCRLPDQSMKPTLWIYSLHFPHRLCFCWTIKVLPN